MKKPAPKPPAKPKPKRTKAERQAGMVARQTGMAERLLQAAAKTPGTDLKAFGENLDKGTALIEKAVAALAHDPSPEELAAWKAEQEGKLNPVVVVPVGVKLEPIERPKPLAGQIWSTASLKNGPRFIWICEVQDRGEDQRVIAVEITKAGKRIVRADGTGATPLEHKPVKGEMGTEYSFEPTLTDTIKAPDQGDVIAAEAAKESTMAKKAKKTSTSTKPTTKQGEPIRSMNRGLQMLYTKQGTFSGYTTRDGKKYAMLVRKAANGDITVLVADEAEKLGRVGHGREASPKTKTAKAPKAKTAKKAKAKKAKAKAAKQNGSEKAA